MHTYFIPWYQQQLKQLKTEINAYQNPSQMWEIRGEVLNSGGNLCTHLLGNLNYFIGAALGNTGYIRQRDLEFSIKDVPVEELSRQIDETSEMVTSVLAGIEDWDAPYPANDYNFDRSIGYQVARLVAHLGYHLGQLNYHRRLMDRP